MKIGIACDHGGFTLKDVVKDTLRKCSCEIIDLGTDTDSSVDYPDYAKKAIDLLLAGGCDRIVLICGTGIGMSICANRVPGVRGTLCHDGFTARMSRMHNDSNCLILGGRVLGPALAQDIVEIWVKTAFEGGRHQERLAKIECSKQG
ncbi:MAG TPA: ribose 5-phosphate isomerase B [Deltaproteobacteria bacterium]|jgi:ribose 5-phosphate isomerase B|nr:ribose 5-phosphate isomerase B [Deltaproteobacteria bacterium]HOI07437.1 ribose 5-phosphate isomerase B [Deltaproteobacteria bacterium]